MENLSHPSLPSESEIFDHLKTVIDPETNLNIVDMGLVYSVSAIAPTKDQVKAGVLFTISVVYTLTTPGCPLAYTLQTSIWNAFADWKPLGFMPQEHIALDLTFDPPWTVENMSEMAKAELGF